MIFFLVACNFPLPVKEKLLDRKANLRGQKSAEIFSSINYFLIKKYKNHAMKKKWDKTYWINIITPEKVDIYHKIFSNKDHINIKNLFRKPLNIGLKVPLIFFHHITE